EKLRRHLLDAQAFHLVVDFGELPVFETAARSTLNVQGKKGSRAKGSRGKVKKLNGEFVCSDAVRRSAG
ncbi:hypothetical protein, partial [Desulfosarcina sp.]|uniref:hypothetical protein n=1 Tax=Desulfosarcina sp. TaxID=2027861 RepID=UPI0039707BA7